MQQAVKKSGTCRTSLPNETYEILLVEDNPADAKLLQEVFKLKNFPAVFHWVVNGTDALDYLFKRGKYLRTNRPDAILLDLNVPKIDGREVLRQIHREPSTSSIPVIVLTGSKYEQDIVNCYADQVVSFMPKPSELSDLEEMVQRLIAVEFPRVGIRAETRW